jgi:DNA gyrase subunit B
LNPGIEIVLKDERDEKTETFFYKDGIEQFVRSWAGASSRCIPSRSSIRANGPAKLTARTIEVFVDCVMQYTDSYNDQILCFANSIPNPTAARI